MALLTKNQQKNTQQQSQNLTSLVKYNINLTIFLTLQRMYLPTIAGLQ